MILVAILVSSCGNQPALMTKEKPFIVGSIESVGTNGKLSTYTRLNFIPLLDVYRRAAIITYSGKYQIGDTIKLYNN
jgi:hypothetical protein